MRSVDSIKNAMVNMTGKIVSLLMQFIVRIYFIRMLGDICLSINGLFTNILSVLSIAELGISFAVCYSMYKPLAFKDQEKTNQIIHLYKKIYFVIGWIIFSLGLILMPFLRYIVKEENMINDIYIIFILYLLKSCISYWFMSYRTTIVEADQKNYKIQRFSYLFDILSQITQLLILIQFKSFIGFMAVACAFVMVKNVIIGIYVGKLYPYILKKPNAPLPKKDRKELFKNIYGISLYKVSGTIYNSSDSIIISASTLLPFVLVGYYSNYTLILNALISLISVFVNSTTASIGNFNITETPKKKEELFQTLNFLNFWIYGVISICCFVLINPFISIMYGERCVLDTATVVVVLINFIMHGLGNTVITFKDACGMFYKGRFRPMVSAALNIIFSVVLIYPFGLAGVMLGTILSRLCSTFWYDTELIYKNVFKMSSKMYYLKYILQFTFIFVIGILTTFLFKYISIDNIFEWVLWGIILFILVNLIFVLCFFRKKEFVYLKSKILNFVKPVMKKIRKLLVKIFRKCFILPIKKVRKLIKHKKYILICSQFTTMDVHVFEYYNSVKHLDYKFKFAFFDYTKINKSKYKNFGLSKKMVITSMASFIWQNPDLIVIADNYLVHEKLFISKFLQLGHGGGPTVNDGTSIKIPYMYGNSATWDNQPKYDIFLEANKMVIPEIEKDIPCFKDRIWFSGNKFSEMYEQEKDKKLEYKAQFGIDPKAKTIMMIGSYNTNSLFHKLGKEIFDEIKKLAQSSKYKFIVSIHPREYINYDENVEPFGKYVDELENFGVIVRKPGENAIPYMVASDLVFCDYSSMAEECVLCEKYMVFSEFDCDKLYYLSLAVRLKDKLPKITSASELEKVVSAKYDKKYKDIIMEEKNYVSVSDGFYKQTCIKATETLLNEKR